MNQKKVFANEEINLDAPLLQPFSQQEEREIADRVRRAWQKKAEKHLTSLNRRPIRRCESIAELEGLMG